MYDRIINNVKRFIDLDDEEQKLFTSLLSTKKYKRKEMLLRNGEVAKHELFIVNGCVKNYTIDNNGFEHISMFAIEDWWTGDMASFTTGTPTIFNIEALEDTEVSQILKPDLELLFDKIPKFEKFFRILYQRSLTTYIERNNQNISFTAEERYLTFIKKYPKFEQRISQKNIAFYLGITPEFLSVLRKKLNR
ncbi:CRP-like cAMP-binding protein [Aquimarina sp. MAR_2010_214]|uniref:Crp/Fnr family transcriptional regulator n=1 Tax=Aquimarina sp. MAR_2010_214 TaxID=1250026 RepID=UPI000C70085E|nr:Crp/Fnr family transcriptional regulator [Aquimarina sp. MAR_2010_214]PKV51533.1 CRP-like cAMP-binding protein [Aquimarina sp. MAR_2010_214]